ncbi:hypothetical protein AMATHDRAFT_57755 [Amanita thiersii Skay4041]|uniref:Uncharacterized protein n=1 Tax=Amanita thiersii Skay4041 TaxID=703135 RepID=A0A2A9NWB1_9AGAR|nr:hypothetical protein AMATHDRAFT_57755 [Amanita thiersii Skay4041]
MMNVLKNQPFFRPASRPTSPTPVSVPPPPSDSNAIFDRSYRPLNMLSLSNFRRPSPVRSNSTPLPSALIQDGSYLGMLNLKFSEAVSKALAQPTGPAAANEQLAGRRPIPQGRARALGTLIASELMASRENSHLYRAVIRSLQKPLSVLLTNLSAYLLPLIASPTFSAVISPTTQTSTLNPTQLHALAIATFAQELLETFDEQGLGLDGDARGGDGLRAIREGLGSLITRVINPLINGIRNELMQMMEALENPTPNPTAKHPASIRGSVAYHPSIINLQATMPVYSRLLIRYTSFAAAQSTLATLLISVVWKALVALSHRPRGSQSLPPSPTLQSMGVKKTRGSPTTTPPLTPQMGRFTIKLPPSRPPSPHALLPVASAAADARVLYELLSQLPRPTADKESTRLAREAVCEAFAGLKALPTLLELVEAASHGRSDYLKIQGNLESLTTDLPLLIALPIVLQILTEQRSVAGIIGVPEEEYRKACLSGFGRAEECGAAIAHRVIDAWRFEHGAGHEMINWLEREIAAD